MAQRTSDILIVNGHLLTMEGSGVGYLAHGAVAVEGNRIVKVGPTEEMASLYNAKTVIDACNCAVMPGLIDAHMHTPYAVIRGVAQDVDHWMLRAFSVYARHVTPGAARAGTRLNIIEAIKNGTTTLSDYAVPYNGWGQAFADSGVRACLTPTINDLPANGLAGLRVGHLYPLEPENGLAATEKAVDFLRNWHQAEDGRIRVMFGPQAPDMLYRDNLVRIKNLAQKEGVLIHMHVAQGDREIEQMLKRYGMRSPDFLDSLGYLDDQLLAVHLTEASETETEMMAHRGVRMVVCSGSIGLIDGIVPPAADFRSAGGPVALGSDQASGNNCTNIFNEMKLTSLFNKIRHRSPVVLPAWEVLRMATIEGARALGLEDGIGSLAAGKQADIILVDLHSLNLTPVLDTPIRNIVPNLVYAATGSEVKTVMVAGKLLMSDRKLLIADEQQIRDEAQEQAEIVARAVADDPLHKDLELCPMMETGML